MSKSSFRTLFLTRKRLTKEGKARINIRVTVNSERAEWATGFECDPKDWLAIQGRAVARKEIVLELRESLKAIETRITQIYKDMILFGEDLTVQNLQNIYFGKNKKEIPSIISLYEKKLEQKKKLIGSKGGITESTYQTYVSKYNKFIDFLCELYFETKIKDKEKKPALFINDTAEEKKKKIDLPVTEIDYDFIVNFEIYMKSSQGKCDHNHATRNLRLLKSILEDARKSKHIDENPFEDFILYYEKVDPVFLEEFELMKLMETNLETKGLEEVRDIFIFCCYTGLSYGDVKCLRKEQIYTDGEGCRWIGKRRIKTGNYFDTPLYEITEKLLRKYENHEYENEKRYILPVRCNQKSNEYLKSIATVCGVNKKISTHSARHTFATMCLTKGVSIEALARILGHTDIKTTQKYARILKVKISREMNIIRPELDKHFEKYVQLVKSA